jgi:hypothetical protein
LLSSANPTCLPTSDILKRRAAAGINEVDAIVEAHSRFAVAPMLTDEPAGISAEAFSPTREAKPTPRA